MATEKIRISVTAALVGLCAFFPYQVVADPASQLQSVAPSSVKPISQPRSADQFDYIILKGLAPVTALENTPAGKEALMGNFAVTGGIQTGSFLQSLPLPLPVQRQQALKDVFIGAGNIDQFADGLGTALGPAYRARAHYVTPTQYTSISDSTKHLIAYSIASSGAHGGLGKWFFANGTLNGKEKAPPSLTRIFDEIHGKPDMFGIAYHRTPGTPHANAFGDPRPFQTLPDVRRSAGISYFGVPTDSWALNKGPTMDLVNSPSYPSGHTTYAYTAALVMAMVVPERYQQMITRAADYSNNRIIMGAHYAMDILGGRTLALYDMAHLLANEPGYMGRTFKLPWYLSDAFGPDIAAVHDYQALLEKARADTRKVLSAACGNTVAVCASEDRGRFRDSSQNEAFYESTQTYRLAVVYPNIAKQMEDIGKLAPEAGYLLTAAFPSLTLKQADTILTETEGPGGGFLDNGSAFGVYSRIDLYAAAGRAAALTAEPASK